MLRRLTEFDVEHAGGDSETAGTVAGIDIVDVDFHRDLCARVEKCQCLDV